MKKTIRKKISVIFTLACILFQSSVTWARESSFPVNMISSQDALLIAEPDQIICKKNENKQLVPASTFKILTSLAAIHYLGRSYQFETQFFQDAEKNLKIKGFGDPLLLSEVFPKIADALAPLISSYNDLIIDDTYFETNLDIPGVGSSTNPYDAPNGAFCANFNTVFFKQDRKGNIVSAEPQTPMIPFAVEKIKRLGLKKGRYTFTHQSHEAAIYAGELLNHFLKRKGIHCQGKIRMGVVKPEDQLIYTYRSIFTLEDILRDMLKFSNNYIANQLFITLGAIEYNAPGNIEKGARLLTQYAKEKLKLKHIQIEEGSGISRQNKMSAMDMLAILKAFEPHRDLLTREGEVSYKTGTLRGVRTRAGYIERESGSPYYFVIFMNSNRLNIESVLNRIVEEIGKR